ncbi:MAG: phosphatase PAP2 family protein [Bacteroidales bacterium]|nr:phosphatase PAP2 family protein [Bacteroidales bacterium]
MIKLLRDNKLIFYIYFIISIFCLYIFLTYSKFDVHLYFNQFHSSFFDFFFKYLTYLGDGIFIVFIAVALLFIRFRYFLLIILPYLVSGFFVQLFKRIIFPGIERPAIYFKDMYDLHLVEGVKILKSFSFPSGHSATVFAFFLILIFLSKNNFTKVAGFLMAILVGYSRIYLSQHFLIDVWAGSLIGMISATFLYIYINDINKPWIDKPFVKLLNLKDADRQK